MPCRTQYRLRQRSWRNETNNLNTTVESSESALMRRSITPVPPTTPSFTFVRSRFATSRASSSIQVLEVKVTPPRLQLVLPVNYIKSPNLTMPRKLRLRSRLSILIIIPALLIEIIQLPAQCQESIQVAQLLDSPSPELSNIQTITRNFFMSLAQREFEQARQYMSPSLATESSSAAQLQQIWQNLLETTGNFVEITRIYPSELLGTYTVLVTARFQNSTSDFVVELDQNQQITTVNFLQLGNIQVNAEKFVDAISQGEYALARSYLSPDLKQQFLPETIEQRWEAILTRLGSFQQRTTSTVARGTNHDAVLINLEFEQYSGGFLVFFNPLGQIVGFESPLTAQQQ